MFPFALALLLGLSSSAQEAEAVAAKKRRLTELLKELKDDPGFYLGEGAAKHWKKLQDERAALIKGLAGDDPARIEALEDELLGRPRSEAERDELRKRLAQVNRKLLESLKQIEADPSLRDDPAFQTSRKPLFVEEEEILEKLVRGRGIDDRDLATQEALKKHAPDVFDGYAAPAALAALKNLSVAAADFRANDRDNNGQADYWVGDVYGLQFLCPRDRDGKACLSPHSPIRLLSPSAVALADAAPLRDAAPAAPPEKPQPHWGYLFGALRADSQGPYHDGSRRNPRRFGFFAVPAAHKESCRWTFVINEQGLAWKKDTGGKAPTSFPARPDEEGWSPAN